MSYFACVICLDGMKSEEEIVATKCGHIYHFDCLNKWIFKSNTCPECRSTLPEGRPFSRIFPNVSDDQSYIEILESQLSMLQKQLDEQKSIVKDFMDGLKSPTPKRKAGNLRRG